MVSTFPLISCLKFSLPSALKLVIFNAKMVSLNLLKYDIVFSYKRKSRRSNASGYFVVIFHFFEN